MIHDLYSRRNKPPVDDVVVYDEIPQKLRGQVIHILRDMFYSEHSYSNVDEDIYAYICSILERENGWIDLPQYLVASKRHSNDDSVAFQNHLMGAPSCEAALDAIEVSFRVVDGTIPSDSIGDVSDSQTEISEAVDELNARFRENGMGYQYENGQIIRTDSQFIHAEITKPALRILQGEDYKGATSEFLSAHEHYRHGKFKECLNDCLKAFESTMKTICDKRGWIHKPEDTASKLVQICLSNRLLPKFSEEQLNALGNVLKSHVPAPRNKLSGHGQGSTEVEVPQHFASFALHSTAANILLLAEAEKALP